MLVSSANCIGLAYLLMVNERSFMHIRNSNGPHTEPCGTQCFAYLYVLLTVHFSNI